MDLSNYRIEAREYSFDFAVVEVNTNRTLLITRSISVQTLVEIAERESANPKTWRHVIGNDECTEDSSKVFHDPDPETGAVYGVCDAHDRGVRFC